MSILNLEIFVDILIYINIFSNKNNYLKLYIVYIVNSKNLYRIMKINKNFSINIKVKS
jgi:hypothetical protein